ncbi:methyltransferase domain-containing protein [bacterium]|nr:methyltransferase domain-containing protein [bacterium]
MLQLAHVVPPEMLFRAYSFFTSSSNRMGEHFSMLMGRFVEESVPSGGLVVEIGSNDGTALASLRHRRVRVLGIDPARNVSVMAASRGVPTITEFFSEPLAAEIARTAGPASLIVACNVLGHIDDLDDVCRGIQRLLDPTGTFVFEVPYLGDLIERAEFDTIYHEHLSYFAVRPLVALFQRHGLALTRVEHFPVHGGTIRGTVVRGETLTDSVRRRIECEERMQLAEPSTFARLDERMRQTRESLRSWLQMQRDAGLTVWGYGAPAKGTVLLNYCGIDTELLPAVVDSTPMKQGLRVPGTRQPIFPPGALTVQKAQRALILAWNHAAEITARECEFQTAGGRLFTPDLREWKHEPGGVEFFGDTPGGFRQSLDVDVY